MCGDSERTKHSFWKRSTVNDLTVCKALYIACGARFLPSTVNCMWECSYHRPKVGFAWTCQYFGTCMMVIWTWDCLLYVHLSSSISGLNIRKIKASLDSKAVLFDFAEATFIRFTTLAIIHLHFSFNTFYPLHICSIPIKGQESAASCLELLSMINKSCMNGNYGVGIGPTWSNTKCLPGLPNYFPPAVPFQLHKTTGWPELATQSVDHILMSRLRGLSGLSGGFASFLACKPMHVCMCASAITSLRHLQDKTRNTLSRARGRRSNSPFHTFRLCLNLVVHVAIVIVVYSADVACMDAYKYL